MAEVLGSQNPVRSRNHENPTNHHIHAGAENETLSEFIQGSVAKYVPKRSRKSQ